MFGFFWFLCLFSFLCWNLAACLGLLYHSFPLLWGQERSDAGLTSWMGPILFRDREISGDGNYEAPVEDGERMRK